MIRGRCPTCGKPFEIERIDDLPSFPFCSERCKLVDLGRWIDGVHVIPGPEVPASEQAEPEEE
jgi:endogenous inhibitor of DNA gyrase (YacG/DUF329 family)